MESILTTSLRTLIGFFLLLILTRILGKKQISQLTFFTYITGIALGSIAGDMVVHRDIKIIDGVTGLTLWAVLTLIMEYVSLKSAKARVLLDGEPSIIIKKGKIVEKAMSANKLNMDDLTMLLRLKDVFSVAEVDYAILEPNGQLSVLKKEEHVPTIRKDFNIQTTPRLYLPTELVVDGKAIPRNLAELNKSEAWLIDQLQIKGIDSMDEILYAELQSDGTIHIDKKE
ncbi:DUF421 domain-containing protein [Bacillus sp. CECT 9360]|uniref:DUF421 domain-containing protein n=1 Tax=Bacillus sp. CECT 9360 TaxID=2845821 RepID=UPI001E328796|nr:DUF421 domain-containing protein [Bacillus sp. CECT 9360]CAH0347458.1 hypothetical protein BCI9360_03858 [Bacillus sp. CECT 9360]